MMDKYGVGADAIERYRLAAQAYLSAQETGGAEGKNSDSTPERQEETGSAETVLKGLLLNVYRATTSQGWQCWSVRPL